MKQSEVSALLGRPLTSYEVTNFKLYLKIAKENLDDLLCTNLCDNSDPRTIDIRPGYSTAFMDIFQSIESVTLNGDVVDEADYYKAQWDRRSGNWYNSLVFENKFCEGDELVVSAAWGFDAMPSDLKAVLAGLFGLITKKNKFDGMVKSKQVEDFRITFDTETDLDDAFYRQYSRIIAKYSLCSIGNIQHGSVC